MYTHSLCLLYVWYVVSVFKLTV